MAASAVLSDPDVLAARYLFRYARGEGEYGVAATALWHLTGGAASRADLPAARPYALPFGLGGPGVSHVYFGHAGGAPPTVGDE